MEHYSVIKRIKVSDTHYDMDEPQKHTEFTALDANDHIFHVSLYLKYVRVRTPIETTRIGGCQGLEGGENAEPVFNGSGVSSYMMKMFGTDGGGDYVKL